MSHQNTIAPQINFQPAPIVLTIITQNESQSEKQHILKVFSEKTILTFSIIQLTFAGVAAILQVIWWYKSFIQISCITIGSLTWFDDKKRFSNNKNLMIKHKNTVRKIYVGYDTGKLWIQGENQSPLRLASLRWCVKKATKANVE